MFVSLGRTVEPDVRKSVSLQVKLKEKPNANSLVAAWSTAQPRRYSLADRDRLIASQRPIMPQVPEYYRTPQRKRGARSVGVEPRPGEDPDRGGQKSYTDDPDGMKRNAKPAKRVAVNRETPKKR